MKDAIRSAKTIEERILEGLKSSKAIGMLGIEILGANILGIQATPEMSRALETETREKLPLEVLVGVSQLMENVPIRWHLTLENMQQWNIAFSNPNRAEGSLDGGSTPEKVSVFNNALRHVVVGAELFPDKGFNIRLGYNFRRAEELRILEQRNFSGISVGIGLKIRKLKFNYSYSRYTLAANTSLFGLTIDFSDNSY